MHRLLDLSARSVLVLATTLVLGACALFQEPPGPTGFDQRLAQIPAGAAPVSAPVTIRWDTHQIPFIEAETDGDGAFALGLVQAHLRLAQLAIFRRALNGRLSESVGPFATDLDTALRTFDFGRAADDIYAAMPEESRHWLERFTDGINFYVENLPPEDLPHEMKVLDIAWEPWRPQDSIAIGRAGGIDVNWITLFGLLRIKDKQLRNQVLARVRSLSGTGTTSYERATQTLAALEGAVTGAAETSDDDTLKALSRFAELAKLTAKSGSNSLVVGPGRSASRGALIASDPHLGFLIPNVWVVAGLRSPSYTITGMMAVGTPVFGFGRNRHLAWGGTNLRATTSEIVAVNDLAGHRFEPVEHDIRVRSWFDTTITARQSPYGPVVSDLAALPETAAQFAVRWIGHTVTDEITALLGAMKARTFEDFRQAMKTFAIPAQTFLVADDTGTIGSVVATRVPARPSGDTPRVIVDPETSDTHWRQFYGSLDLPYQVNPKAGFLASANNKPSDANDRPFTGFFPQDERVRRIVQLLEADDTVTVDDLKALQMDTVSLLTREVIEALRNRLEDWTARTPDEKEAIGLLLNWDGDYAVDSRAAPVFEAFLTRFGPAVYESLERDAEYAIYQRLRLGRKVLIEDVRSLTEEGWRQALGTGLERAAEVAGDGTRWGDIHKLRVQHVFGNLPLIGGPYRIGEISVPGSRETVFKTSHQLTDEEHTSTFGAQSRHISDLSDPDENYFVLFGGQDGRINSPNFKDQVDLWQRGEYVRIPLSAAGVKRAFPRQTTLRPGGEK